MLLKTSAMGVALLCGSAPLYVQGLTYDLTKLTRLCVETEELSSAAVSDHGLSQESLLNFAYVALKAKLPRLELQPRAGSCDDTLWIIVSLDTRTRDGVKTGSYGAVRISVTRPTLWLSGKVGSGIAYERGQIFMGRMGSAARLVNTALEELLTNFAAEYYKAGNP